MTLSNQSIDWPSVSISFPTTNSCSLDLDMSRLKSTEKQQTLSNTVCIQYVFAYIYIYEMNCGQNEIVWLGCLYCIHIYKYHIITSIYVVFAFRWPGPFSDFKHGNMVHRRGIPLKVDEVEPKSMLLRPKTHTLHTNTVFQQFIFRKTFMPSTLCIVRIRVPHVVEENSPAFDDWHQIWPGQVKWLCWRFWNETPNLYLQ